MTRFREAQNSRSRSPASGHDAPSFSTLAVGSTYTVELNFEDIVGQENVYTFSGTGGMSSVSYAGLYSGQTTFQVQAIPEPSSTAVCSGLLVLGLVVRGRRRR